MTAPSGEKSYRSATAAIIQMCSTDDREHNLAVAGELLEDAQGQGAELMVLPENFAFMGQDLEAKRRHLEDPETGVTVRFLQETAKSLGVWIVGGSITLAIPDSPKAANASLLVGPDGVIQARYDKMHLFDVNLGGGEALRESDFVQAGKTPVVAETPFGRLGLVICYDLRFPELFRALSQQGATIFALPAAFTLTTGQAHWELLLRARAVENFAYLLASAQWGRHADGRRTYGHAMVVEPWGTVTARAPEGDGFILADLNPKRVEQSRRKIPCLQHRVL
ncbi:MAG: carbon-nitrogen hydrolase family protein [Magnetococcales bacterium]|nr:carbon-nitrogen hydrolase family protein [Magnetococcales bacterium]